VSSETTPLFALSIKQPWAALVVGGLKTIEIRRWPTARRGRILVHAARVPDERPEALRHVPAELLSLTKLRGGIIGAVELTDCLKYDDLPAFQADQCLHRNEPSWFEKPTVYGFVFTNPERLLFRKYPGWFRFFPVKGLAGLQRQANGPRSPAVEPR
jgi:hypothetical protein